MKSIQLRAVSRAYGRTFALHRVSMSFEAATITAILGGNGAGKTTLLNILATLAPPSSGEILYDRTTWPDFARRGGRARIGWVSHDSLVYDELTGHENLAFFARMYGLTDALRRVDTWIDRVGLGEAAHRRVSTYSRGMRQRLTVARALLHEPSLVLLDEPTTGLDQQGTRDITDIFCRLRDKGCIVVLITHDFSILPDRIDQLAVLRRGQLTFCEAARSSTEIIHAYEQFA